MRLHSQSISKELICYQVAYVSGGALVPQMFRSLSINLISQSIQAFKVSHYVKCLAMQHEVHEEHTFCIPENTYPQFLSFACESR